jgi:hypothetical protein
MSFFRFLIGWGLIFNLIAGSEEIILRGQMLPGANFPPQSRSHENAKLTEQFSRSGTMAMWVRPEGWSNDDQAWHFFLTAGVQDKNTPYIYFYRFPDGKTRLLWSLNHEAKQTGELISTIPFADGKWTHLAFSWDNLEFKFYVNGVSAGQRRLDFAMGDALPLEWKIGDIPQWNPKSKFGTTLGRVEIHPRALTADEISGLARQRMVDGLMTVVNRQFTPGSSNRIYGFAEATGEAALEIAYVDELGAVKTENKSIELKDQRFDTLLTIPKDTVETRLTLKGRNGRSPFWKLERIQYADWLPPVEPDYWQASWIWHGNAQAPEAHRYFVLHFEADPDELELAAFQGASDDQAVVYLNGKETFKMFGWAVPTVNEKLKPLLIKGKNSLAVDAYNVSGGSGFLGELALVGKDGSVRRLATDGAWAANDKAIDGWNQPDFDVSIWGQARVIMRPPQLPYGETVYRDYRKLPELEMISDSLQLSATAGKSVSLRTIWQAPPSLPATPVHLLLLRQDKELFRSPLQCRIEEGKMILDGEVTIPPATVDDEYELKLENRGIVFHRGGDIGKLTVKAIANPVPLKAEVQKINGLPTLLLNGSAVPPMLYRNAINFRNNTRSHRYMTGFDREGIRLMELNIYFQQLWRPDGTLNTEDLELHLLSAFYYAPNSKLMVFINTDAPDWYVKAHPDERYANSGGPVNRVSYASERWREDSTKFLSTLISYIKSRSYYNQIAGFGFDGGEDGQFMQWTGRNLNYMGDYSPAMKTYFQSVLKEKYGTVAELNRRWGKNYPSFAEIEIPSTARRQNSPAGFFLDPVQDADIVDYNQAFSDAVADTILAYAATVKSLTNRERLVAAYYGKFFSIAGYLDWGEFSIGRMIASPDFDYFIAVEYAQRAAGNPHSVSAPLGSYTLHNKIFIDEADIRTFLSGSKSWAYAGTFFETIAMIRKMFIYSWSKGHGIHWYDLHGGIFEYPGILRAIGHTHKVAAQTPPRRFTPAEVAIIVDESSFLYTTTEIKKLSARAVLHLQNGNISRMGADFDVYFLSDLKQKDFPAYKMYAFLNAWAPDAEAVKAIEKLKNDGRVLVWLYNSGLISNGVRTVDNVSKLTGITMADAGRIPLAMCLDPAAAPEAFRRISGAQYTSAVEAAPVAYPVDPKADCFGRFLKTPDKSPLALKKFDRWTSFYSAVPVLTPATWRELARMAGVHIYTDDPDTMLYIDASILGVHSGRGGDKTVNWPRTASFSDAITGEVYGSNTRTLKLNMLQNETKIIWVK